ncbi:hypothetical protein F511_08560 [Dorcoceras hygrometricum]|uniref:Uncharacterized protein n=1 Tax=Dorcoceras hygrometricum TaxID=472368 RepID=A0A2Z7CY03_9LAMI|nr:hypothetical protein F511_08560 [Dorcoceras hygrometricum]
MADEKHISKGSNSRSKKDKLKKVPQRGLGVAQLEKMRMEEQQKNDSIEISNFRPPFPNSPNPIPLPPPRQTSLVSPNALFRHTQLVSHSETLHQSPVPKAITSPRCGDWSTISNGELNLEGESRMLDGHGLTFQPRVNVSYDTNASVLPLPSVPQRSLQSHQLPSSSSSLTANPSPSSVSSYRMELPSNQIFRSNNYIPMYPEEDKMVGMKRAYPFSLETPPAPSFNRNFHSTYSASISKSEELGSCSNRYTVHLEPRNKYIREGPSNSSPLHERNHSEVTTDSRKLNGDFLSLAPPAAVPLLANSNSKHAVSYLSQVYDQ